ncbi:MAG: fructose-1,6-bisphosphatase [bacterium]
MESRYFELLSKKFPTIAAASTEIINLEAILSLPKGTEHFLTDIHGEHEAFDHVLRNASGAVTKKVTEEFGKELRDKEKRQLCSLIYYPEERLEIVKREEADLSEWYMITLIRLVRVCRAVASKYTRSKVRKALPESFSYIIQELMHENEDDENKSAYVHAIFNSIIQNGSADAFIVAMSQLIQRLVVDRLHIVGDIFDRGPGAHLIIDKLRGHHNLDIQWGNHDVLWMGAAAGNEACMATVLRISLRYANLTTLEDGYGINLLSLATFAMEQYANDPCTVFLPKTNFADMSYDEKNIRLIAQMHKAISVIQWKLEYQLRERRSEWNLGFRNRLDKVNQERGVVVIDGVEYTLKESNFPTVDPAQPFKLTEEERNVMDRLHHSFVSSHKLHDHLHFLLEKGSVYLVYNGNLLFHAAVPLDSDGRCKEVEIAGEVCSGKVLLDKMDSMIRIACMPCRERAEYDLAVDYMWYWWCGEDSPTFNKSHLATFERYLVEDKTTHKEQQGEYYNLRNNPDVCDYLFAEFGVEGAHRHIINGHVPVKTMKGESPVRANGRLLVIDGGFSKAYHSETGIAGYTLVFNSHGLQLVQHEPFESKRKAIEQGVDIKGTRLLVEFDTKRMMVSDSDVGKRLLQQVEDLKELLDIYKLRIK